MFNVSMRSVMRRFVVVLLALGVTGAVAQQRAIERAAIENSPVVPALERIAPFQSQLAFPLAEHRTDPTLQAVTFTRLFRSNFTNITYFFPSSSLIVYEPGSNVLATIEHVPMDNRATGGDLGAQLYFRYSINRGTTWTRQLIANNSSTFYGVPQLALANPSNVTSATDLKLCVTGYQYPKETNYYRRGTAIFVWTEGQIYEHNELGPIENNPDGYYFGSAKLAGFTAGADRSGFAYCGILQPPNNQTQYGQYGSLVINARLAGTEDFISLIPDSWSGSVFRPAPATTSTYNSPMYVDADANGNLYAVINGIFADAQDSRVVAVSKSSDMGQTWSAFERMPASVLQAYATNRGAAAAVPFRVYDQHDMVVTGENRFSYIQRIALLDAQQQLAGVDLVETEYNAGNWTIRLIAPIADIPVVYSYNDSASQARNYEQLVCDEVISSLGNEIEVARTADGSALVVKWIDAVPSAGSITINPPQTAIQYDQQTGQPTGEVQVDSLPVFNIFLAYRSLSDAGWSQPKNLTEDRYFNKGTHIPRIVPSLSQIPLLVLRSLAPSDWNQQSPAGRLLASAPQDFVNRIYDIPHDVSYALVSAVSSVEPTAAVSQARLTVSPTPASDQIEVACAGITSNGQLVVVNPLGQIVLERTLSPSSGVQGTMLDVHALPAGSYSIQLRVQGSVVATAPALIVR